MNKYEIIDVKTWKRRALFESYQQFDNQTFCITFESDVGRVYRYCREHRISFFLLTLFVLLKAANRVPEMRQRIIDSEHVIQFERIAVQTPIMCEDEIFIPVILEYFDAFAEFRAAAEPQIADAAKNGTALLPERQDFFSASCAPWLDFTSLTHANFSFKQSLPVLTWGKMKPNGRIPVSTQFNHSLIDGFQVSRFANAIEEYANTPENLGVVAK